MKCYTLGSSIELGNTASRVIDGTGNEYDASTSDSCYIDDLYHPEVISYKTEAMASVTDFDIALTKEYFGNGPRRLWERKAIVSQNFRRVMNELGVDLEYTPVKLKA